MTPVAAARSIGATLLTFLVVALLLSGVIGGAAGTGGDFQYFAIGLAALLAPLTAVLAGAWQARAAGITRPLVGILPPAALALALGLIGFATNETQRESFNTLQPILVVVGAIAGAAIYGVRWFGGTRRV